MARALILNEDRLFPAEPGTRAVARELYARVRGLPIISPHGHCDPAWFAINAPFSNAADLLLAPDHYLYRMLFSQGVAMEELRVPGRSGIASGDPRAAWRRFAEHFHLFRDRKSTRLN